MDFPQDVRWIVTKMPYFALNCNEIVSFSITYMKQIRHFLKSVFLLFHGLSHGKSMEFSEMADDSDNPL